jgi:hypothetical protein
MKEGRRRKEVREEGRKEGLYEKKKGRNRLFSS